MAEEKKIATGYIGNALRSTASDHTTTFIDEVFDTERQKYQSEVNADIEERIEAEITRAEAAEKILTDEINELVLRIGIYGTFIGTSTHWDSTPYSIELHSDTLYVLKNISNEAFLGYRLFKDGVNIQEQYVTVESGKSISFVPLQDADAIVVYFNQVGSKAEILLFDVSTIADKLDKSQIIGESGDGEELVPTQKLVSPAVVAVGEIAKVSKPSGGWSNAPIAECHFEEGKRYFIINTGENDFISVRVYDEDKTIKGSFDPTIPANSYKFVTATATGKYIDPYFKGGGSTIKVYSDESIIAKLQDLYDTKFGKDNIVDNSGNASDKVMTQNATTLLSDSIFSTNNVYLKGIVSILLVTNYADAKAFRVVSYIHNSSWKLYFVVQKKVGETWQGYDAVELSANESEPSGIETITSKYGRFKIVVNWTLMTTGSASSMDVGIKNTAIPYTLQNANKDIDSLKYINEYIREYAVKDSPKRIINVDINGNGDYTSISDAYNSIHDSAFDNQYEIRVFPGVYNEDNLFPPAYTHTHGLHPNTVIVTSVGLPISTHPVFDMDKTCKLSNMTIISAYGYCVHQDMGVGGRLCVCENLYCKKVYGATSDNPKGADVRNYGWKSYTNPSVLGMGMGGGSYMLIWKNCTFENGEVASHTNANDDTYPNTTIIYENCKCVNAYIYLMVAGGYNTNGKYICDIMGLKMPIGQKALKLTYKEENSPWTILGGDNENFAVEFDNQNGTTEAWKNICSNDKSFIQLANGVSSSKGQWVDVDGNICNSSTNKSLIFGVALEDMAADSKEALPVWIGNAYKVSLSDGEYGIGTDGRLSASASNKVGIVKNGIFYLVK